MPEDQQSPTQSQTRYPQVSSTPAFPEIEERILRYWSSDGTFEASVAARPADGADGARGGNEFVFYDGPPFANGLPHYGHLLTGYVKDVVPRYQTMRGHRVERRFGWDCHGLPAEIEAEKQLGVVHRPRSSRWASTGSTTPAAPRCCATPRSGSDYVTRQARWVDFENDYKTMDLDYMESVMWAFKSLVGQGPGLRGLPGAALLLGRARRRCRNFETRLDDAYRPAPGPGGDRRDANCSQRAGGPAAEALIWTTTPWTLPSQPGAGGATRTSTTWWSSRPRAARTRASATCSPRPGSSHYARELGEATVVAHAARAPTWSGHATRRCSPTSPGAANAFQVLGGDFVTTDEGTGVVHMAPGFGEDDKRVCEAAGIEPVVPVDDQGRFTAEVPDYAGQHVFDANPRIIADLKAAGTLVRHETYDHNYPHCWRSDNADDLQGGLLLVRRGHHVPRPHGRAEPADQLGARARPGRPRSASGWRTPATGRSAATASGARRSRSGSATTRATRAPTSTARSTSSSATSACARPTCTGPTSTTSPGPTPMTRPGARRCAGCRRCSTAGSSPARCRSPRCTTRSRTREWFEDHYPGDFIVEYIGQTRGWFYTMHVLATALFDRPAFSNCVCHGIVLDDDGRKMSKRLRNYPDVARGLRPRRRRRDALVPDVLADPARRRPGGHRAGHPRRRPAGAAAAVERLVLLRPVRQRLWRPGGRRLRRAAPYCRNGVGRCARPVPAGQDPGAGRSR